MVDKEGNIASWIQSVYGRVGARESWRRARVRAAESRREFRAGRRASERLAARKRPFHTIIPGIRGKGDLHIGFGIMGGPNQPLAHAQFMSNLADHGMNIQMALEAPRFTKNGPAGCDVQVENRVGLEMITELTRRGHKVEVRGAFSTNMGRGAAVLYNTKTKMKEGACDPRSDGIAAPE